MTLRIIATAALLFCSYAESKAQADIDTAILLQQVNTLRAAGCKCGDKQMPAAQPLKWNVLLANAAQDHSVYMNQNKRLEHQGADGNRAGDRITKKGYEWRTYGENVAMGPETVEAVIEVWKNSPSHCKNMMKQDFTEIGLGRSGKYWTQVFGTPK